MEPGHSGRATSALNLSHLYRVLNFKQLYSPIHFNHRLDQSKLIKEENLHGEIVYIKLSCENVTDGLS